MTANGEKPVAADTLTFPEINLLRVVIASMLVAVSVTTAWQRCRDEHALRVGLTSFREYGRLQFPSNLKPDAVTLWRPAVAPGSEAQIDYGFWVRGWTR